MCKIRRTPDAAFLSTRLQGQERVGLGGSPAEAVLTLGWVSAVLLAAVRDAQAPKAGTFQGREQTRPFALAQFTRNVKPHRCHILTGWQPVTPQGESLCGARPVCVIAQHLRRAAAGKPPRLAGILLKETHCGAPRSHFFP